MSYWKLLVLYATPVSPESFREHYLGTHLPLTASLPGLLASRYAFTVQVADDPPPYFCIWEGEFESAEAIAYAMQSPAGQTVQADAASIATGGITIVQYLPVGVPA